MDPRYIEVRAEVRYWEDATVNGTEDADGTLIPRRNGDLWCPVIRLSDGVILDWPAGVCASIHYKVCDQGEYWLLDAQRVRIAKRLSDYVPDSLLCPKESGDGDYIIFDVDSQGKIIGWSRPEIAEEEWKRISQEAPKESLLPADEKASVPEKEEPEPLLLADEEVSALLQPIPPKTPCTTG